MWAELLKKLEISKVKDNKKKILIYCTGGIRCEKIGHVLREQGYNDVFQLQGGIVNYSQEVKAGLRSRFIGKNFNFDSRYFLYYYILIFIE